MSMFGGTIPPFIVERGEYGGTFLREPTADELAKMEAEHEATVRRNAAWEAGRPERERLEAEQRAKWESDRRAHLAECNAAFPVVGISGEYNDYGNGVFLETWPSDTLDLYPKEIKFVMDKCDFCGESMRVLEVDNSWGEYNSLSACRDCLGKMFDAFEAKVLSA